jgi:regulatory protein
MKRVKASDSTYESGLRFLTRRSHSRWELKVKLQRKGFTREEIDKALYRFRQLGYLDDRAFAYEYCRYRLRRSPRGFRLLSAELAKRGVSRKVIDEVLVDMAEEFPEDDLVAGLVEKWRRQHRQIVTRDDISKLMQSLGRKGFDWECIRRQVDGIKWEDVSSGDRDQ